MATRYFPILRIIESESFRAAPQAPQTSVAIRARSTSPASAAPQTLEVASAPLFARTSLRSCRDANYLARRRRQRRRRRCATIIFQIFRQSLARSLPSDDKLFFSPPTSCPVFVPFPRRRFLPLHSSPLSPRTGDFGGSFLVRFCSPTIPVIPPARRRRNRFSRLPLGRSLRTGRRTRKVAGYRIIFSWRRAREKRDETFLHFAE